MHIATPYYLIDEKKLQRNMEIIQRVRQLSGARSLLALKCFSTCGVFDLMRKYMDGTTSSSLYEARLGFEKFGKETHAYCVGYSPSDIESIAQFADKIIFNSASQLDEYYDRTKSIALGLRVNPGISYSHFDLADPARDHAGGAGRGQDGAGLGHAVGLALPCGAGEIGVDVEPRLLPAAQTVGAAGL